MLAVVVREAISQIAAPDMAQRIERAALERYAGSSLPADPVAFKEFVEGPLMETIVDYLGDDVAEAIARDLAPMLAHVTASAAVASAPVASEPPVARELPVASELALESEPVRPSEPALASEQPTGSHPPDDRVLPTNRKAVLALDDGEFEGLNLDALQLDGLELDWAETADSESVIATRSADGADSTRELAENTITEPPEDSAKPSTGRGSVLVADDDPQMLRATARALRDEGFEVVTAADGYAALEICQSTAPDVVIADLHMPAISGRQLIQTLERTMGRDAPPVIIVTGNVFAPTNIQGAAEVMRKPLNIEDLTTAVELAAWDHAAGI